MTTKWDRIVLNELNNAPQEFKGGMAAGTRESVVSLEMQEGSQDSTQKRDIRPKEGKQRLKWSP